MSAASDEDIAGIHYEIRRVADALESLPAVELRDLFALVALHAQLSSGRSVLLAPAQSLLPTFLAPAAYAYADAMLEARANPK